MKKIRIACLSFIFFTSYTVTSIFSQPEINSKEQLINVLSRSITMHSFINLNPTERTEQAQMLADMNARFIHRAVGVWGAEDKWETWYPIKVQETVDAIDKAYTDAGLDLPIIQAGVYEYVGTSVEDVTLPGWIIDEFHPGTVNVDRPFDLEAMLYERNHLEDQFPPGFVPDISKVETQMWFYFQCTNYINLGIDAIHFGDFRLMNDNDPGHVETKFLLDKIRTYALQNENQKKVLIDAHTFGYCYNPSLRNLANTIINTFPNLEYFIDIKIEHGTDLNEANPCNGENAELVFDFHSYPIRADEVINNNGVLEAEINPEFGIYNKSCGGISPQLGYYDEAPYYVEIDNGSFGIQTYPGDNNPNDWILWGYDEITWFSQQPGWYRCKFLEESYPAIKEFDPHGSLTVIGIRRPCLSQNEWTQELCGINWLLSDHPDEIDCIKEIWSNKCELNIDGEHTLCVNDNSTYEILNGTPNEYNWSLSDNLSLLSSSSTSLTVYAVVPGNAWIKYQTLEDYSENCTYGSEKKVDIYVQDNKINTPQITVHPKNCINLVQLNVSGKQDNISFYEWNVWGSEVTPTSSDKQTVEVVTINEISRLNYELTVSNVCDASITINGSETVQNECLEGFLTVYPNPVNHHFNVTFENFIDLVFQSNQTMVYLIDVNSKIIQAKQVTKPNILFNVSSLSNGYYYIVSNIYGQLFIEEILILN